eukprot:scaffold7063_cov188-Prasinococcus_capsulatus_cf.AAC.1
MPYKRRWARAAPPARSGRLPQQGATAHISWPPSPPVACSPPSPEAAPSKHEAQTGACTDLLREQRLQVEVRARRPYLAHLRP